MAGFIFFLIAYFTLFPVVIFISYPISETVGRFSRLMASIRASADAARVPVIGSIRFPFAGVRAVGRAIIRFSAAAVRHVGTRVNLDFVSGGNAGCPIAAANIRGVIAARGSNRAACNGDSTAISSGMIPPVTNNATCAANSCAVLAARGDYRAAFNGNIASCARDVCTSTATNTRSEIATCVNVGTLFR